MSNTNLFQAIQFSKSSDNSISNSSGWHKNLVSMSKKDLFQTIQFSISIHFNKI